MIDTRKGKNTTEISISTDLDENSEQTSMSCAGENGQTSNSRKQKFINSDHFNPYATDHQYIGPGNVIANILGLRCQALVMDLLHSFGTVIHSSGHSFSMTQQMLQALPF